MKSFIREVLVDLKSKNYNFSELVFVLPSKRAGSYLKKELAVMSDKTEFAPHIISIEDFVKVISGLESITPIESLFYFYKAYKSISNKDQIETFDSVASWAQMLIGDFNEIDRFLVEPNTIFNYLSSIKELNSWSLDGEQTEAVKTYLAFWKKIEYYYNNFNEHLLKDSKGHQGLIYREAIHNLESYIASEQKLHHVFVGFNALNKAEEILINELLKQDLASIYWDIDTQFLTSKHHDAGFFIRQHKSKWNFFKTNTFNWISDNYNKNKTIHVSGCSKQIGQIKHVAEILSDLISSGNNLENTAVVLGDESLLQPLLNSIPKEIDKLNITMGLPLKNSSLSFLFETLFKIHKSGTDTFYHKDIISILQHPILQQIDAFSALIKHVKEKNITYISLNYLNASGFKFETELINILLSKWNDKPLLALENMLKLVKIIKTSLVQNAGKNKVELEYLYNYYKVFNELKSVLLEYNYITTIKGLHNLFKEIISTGTIDFEGDPYNGLQIMGMLESRVLDFETVIITSVNEGILPAGKTNNSFIPFETKIENGLPTYKEKDAVYTYHFYRLLQRAKNVYITYNTEQDVLKGGEMSRFIRQLEFEGIHNINHSIVSSRVNSLDTAPLQIEKDEMLMEDLREVAKKGFSPSSLTNYIRNPIDFYNQTLLGINTFEDVEETVASNTFGNIIHKTLEDIYKPFIGKELTVDLLHKEKSNINKRVTLYFEKEYKKEDYLKGKNLLSFEIAKRYIENFLEQEIEVIKAGNTIKILALEKPLTTQLKIEDLNFPIKLKGFVDRIDLYNETLRIIDYKTGKVDQSKVELVNWEDLNTDYDKYSKSFQILMYAYMYSQTESITNHLEAGIISFKNLKNGFLKFAKKDKYGAYANKETDISQEMLEQFLIQLKLLLLEIFDQKIPLTEKQL